uniref:Uncharacterized protein n=1 Tax=Ditylenchus dipsaci TaxID=166011 RepID=A0A915DT86_9BILA
MSSSSTEIARVADFPKLPDERHQVVYSGNRIWFFGQKFLDQPTFHFGHFVTFAGAHSTSFNTDTNEFDQAPKAFAPISTEENLAELIFVFQSRIYLLLYIHFGGFRVTQLYTFNDINRTWEKFADVEQTLILVDGETKEGKYFVSFVDHQIRVHVLKISATYASWEVVGSIPDKINIQRIQPTAAVLIQNKVYIQGGVHGCGFRYQPLSMLQFDLSDKSALFKEIASEDNKPSFAFSGATYHLALPESNSWAHLTGKNTAGMTGSAFNGQIWLIKNVDSEQPKWQKQSLEIPDPKESDFHV